MAFGSGKSAKVFLNGYDLTTYFNKASASESQALYDSSTFGSDYRQFLAGFSDGTITLEGFFDGEDGAVDEVLEGAIGAAADGLVLLFPAGDAVGKRGRGALTIESAYATTAPVDGIVGITASLQSDQGLDPVLSLHALAAETSDDDGASVDNAAASTNGGAGYVMGTDFDGTDITVKIQHSDDDSTYVDLITFTAIDAANAYERMTVTGTVNEYLRASWAGTYTSATFVVAFGRR
jgi:hypothetical protein